MRYVTLILTLLLVGCSERQTDRYDSLDQLRAAHMFEKGWLPQDVLPTSARDIRLTTEVDASIGDGMFEFACRDYDAFVRQMEPDNASRSGHPGQDARIEKRLAARDVSWWSYRNERGAWLFVCRSGRACECDFFTL